jgi:hypothetical protein
MLAAALQAGAEAYIGRFADERNENGRQPVVRNGSAQARTLLTSAGAVEVTAVPCGCRFIRAGQAACWYWCRPHRANTLAPPLEHVQKQVRILTALSAKAQGLAIFEAGLCLETGTTRRFGT